MKTRVITAVVGLAFLALVLTFFDTLLFDLTLTGLCLRAIHEVFSAMGFGKKQWYLFAAAVPYTLLVMLSSSAAVRALLLPASFLLGGGFLLLVDDLARTLYTTELPLGILTAVIGAPFFLYLLRRKEEG